MTLATTNRAQVRYIVESAFGTIPGAGNPNNLRFTGESLAYSIKSDTSKEIRSDRQITDLILTGASAQGGVNFELSYKEYDTLLQAALMGTWAVFGTNGVSGAVFSGTINSTANTITAAVAPTANDAFTTLAPGQWIQLIAPTDAANGQYVQVSKTVAPTSTLITLEALPVLLGTGSRAAVANCKIATSRLSNGTTMRSFSVERGLTDISQFFAYRGMNVGKLSMNFQSGAITTGSFDFTGKDSVRAATTQMPGTAVASQTYDVMNAVSGVGNILENGAALANTFIKSLKFDLDNKLRARDAIGTLGAVDVGAGTVEVKGDLECYLADGSLYDKFIANTATSLTWSSKDGAGNGYVFQFPKVKFGDAKVSAGGLDSDVMLSLPFTALMDTATSKTILIDRLGVAA